MGRLTGDSHSSWANDISADGSVVVGEDRSASAEEAFRWTQGGGMIGLGDLPGGSFSSRAYDVSADGSVIVGQAASASGFEGPILQYKYIGTLEKRGAEAFIWDQISGMWSVERLLTTQYGLDLTGWHLTAAHSVSDDGRTIVGYGVNPAGATEAWIASIAGMPGTLDNPLLPIDSGADGWQFDFTVPDLPTPIYIDPLVAIGYDYFVDSGPSVSSVLLPSVGDNLYDLWLWDTLTSSWLDSGIDITGGSQYSFGLGGLDRFRILGIELSAGLDPSDATAFVTGLWFTNPGPVRMRMAPISLNTEVIPAPGALVLLSIGLAGLGFVRRRLM